MKDRLEALKQDALEQLHKVADGNHLNELRVKYLGKKGALTEILRGMGSLSAEERPVIGQVANEVRGAIEALVEEKSVITSYSIHYTNLYDVDFYDKLTTPEVNFKKK